MVRDIFTLFYLFVYALVTDLHIFKVEKPTSEQGLDDHIYEGQNSVYQLLERDGKSVGGHWEPPAYQGLAKRVTEGTWSEGEVYTNPVIYQDLKKNDTTSKENLPAYHPALETATRQRYS